MMDTVQVALRIRPLLDFESEKGCVSCLETFSDIRQVKISNNAFTFDYVFDQDVSQQDVYESAVKKLVLQLFKGYNVTVLAYGQTGSGKTHSMGTNNSSRIEEKGIIPRAVEDIFEHVSSDVEWEYEIKTSFVELYNEQLYDLLANKPKEQCIVDIREDSRGIVIPGLTEIAVSSAQSTLQCLDMGSCGRAVGSTAMNSKSSRSHAIFTIYLNITKKSNSSEAMSAKFHLVDLAGSERSKKTKAIGDRFKEGININKGLFILGNVISALGEGSQGFINYRDSKLTRLLQDSLGGNALTIMIACISPADANHYETLSTLRYADRAKKIKNKPIVNQDPKAAEIARLKRENEELKLELLARDGTGNKTTCPPEHLVLSQKLKMISEALRDVLAQNASLSERALIAEKASETFKQKLSVLNSEYNQAFVSLSNTLNEDQIKELSQLQSHILDIQAEQKRSEEEINTHQTSADRGMSEISPHTNEKDFDPVQNEDDERHLMKQSEYSKQLMELSEKLAWKEKVVSTLLSSNSEITEIQSMGENNLKELQQQIAALEVEKEELQNQLKSVQSNNNIKIAEQRRKQLQELEQKISNLTKKVTEQSRIIKMKEVSEKKIDVLNVEILSMKQAKVRLVNQMKTESEKYRSWRLERERELCKLKQQDRQRLNQITKMQVMHVKQQNVLKRKVEEAAAINKRLKDAMALQKSAQSRRNLNGNPEKISQWINQELEVLLSTLVAEKTLDQLIEDRATLNKDLIALKAKYAEPNLNPEDKTILQSEIKQLNQNIDLRSTQILDLKQKISDSDQENKAKTRWESLQSMVDAKYALKFLFEAVTNAMKESANKETMLQDIHDIQTETLNAVQVKEKELSRVYKAMQNLEREYEEKIFVLLRQLKGIENGSSTNKAELMEIEQDELSKMEELRSNLDHWIKKYNDLEEKCKELENQAAKKNVLKAVENVTPTQIKVQTKKTAMYFETPLKDVESDSSDDPENDPDWTRTPLYKRLQSLKARVNSNIGGAKRNSDGVIKCICRGNCSRKLCSCRKVGTKCAENCKCNSTICVNRDSDATGNNTSNDSGISPKKPRLTDSTSTELNTTYTTANSSISPSSTSNENQLNSTFVKPTS
uniref:Kinesin motor domain-containing protein n=1 Tax=Clastoptera arizonana TaxID=38151 RepID=A0A1B6E537_9HEMI